MPVPGRSAKSRPMGDGLERRQPPANSPLSLDRAQNGEEYNVKQKIACSCDTSKQIYCQASQAGSLANSVPFP
jgi:hypothetical protein